MTDENYEKIEQELSIILLKFYADLEKIAYSDPVDIEEIEENNS